VAPRQLPGLFPYFAEVYLGLGFCEIRIMEAAHRAGLHRKLLIVNSLQTLPEVVAPVYDRLSPYFAELYLY